MNHLPRLNFLPPEIFDNAMIVEEIDLGHKDDQAIAPFKGSKFIVRPNESSPLDIHDVRECWFVAAGSGIVTYNGTQQEAVKPGDVLLFDSQQGHAVLNNGAVDLLIFSVWWKP